MKCQKCNKKFEEKDIELSHDIPKYLGGTDLDGRHWLCKNCHYNYDEEIILRCLKYLGEKFDGNIIGWQKELSKQPKRLKEILREFAKQVKEEWYGRNKC